MMERLQYEYSVPQTLRPNIVRKGTAESSVGCCANDEKLSKYQEKKAKRQLKREAKVMF